MAFALVGSVGAVSVGANGAAVTPAWGVGESRTAGNLLVCVVFGGTSSPSLFLLATPAGWFLAVQNDAVSGNEIGCAAGIYYRFAAGADAAPTIPAVSGAAWSVQLMEFSGAASTSPVDQTAVNGVNATTSPQTATAAGTDVAPGELIVYSAGARTATGTKTLTSSLNNSAVAQSTNNNATSIANHYSFGYGITTDNVSADSATLTLAAGGGAITGIALAVASFKLPATYKPEGAFMFVPWI